MAVADRSERRYTWQDYQAWGDSERWELIGGEPFCMSPAPSSRHQAIVTDLSVLLHQALKNSSCRVLVSPIDVKLSDENVVQPDIVAVCDRSQIRETHIEGPPTLVVEVLSPSTSRHDRVRKLRLYARFGVQEYWLVKPYPPMVEVLQLVGETYRVAGVYTETDDLRSPTLPDLVIGLAAAFTLPVGAEERSTRSANPRRRTRRAHLPDRRIRYLEVNDRGRCGVRDLGAASVGHNVFFGILHEF